MFKYKLWIYFKKYYGYIILFFSFLFVIVYIYIKTKKETNKTVAFVNGINEVKERIKENKDITELELKTLQNTSRTFDRQVKNIRKTKDSKERRRKINNLMKNIPSIILLLTFLSTCAIKKNYPSYLPPRIDTIQYLHLEGTNEIEKLMGEKDLEESEIYGRIPFTYAYIETLDGNTLTLNGGFVFDDYEAIKFIQYNHERQVYKRQLDLMEKAYNDLYDNAVLAEKLYQERCEENIFDNYRCELCFTAGAGLCLGVLQSVDTIIEK